MKIIEIIPQLSSGGGERFTVDLCNELAGRGHEVMLVVLHELNDTTGFYKNELTAGVSLISMNKRMGFDWRLLFRLRKWIKIQHPDVVHTHLRGIMYSIFSILTNYNVIYCHTVHSAARRESGNCMDTWIRKACFKRGWVIPVTISKDSHRSFVEFYKIGAPLIVNGRNIPQDIAIPVSISQEIEGYKVTPHTKILVHLARMEKVKRHTLLARAVKRLVSEGFDIVLLMIGRKNKGYVEEINKLNCPAIYMLGEKHNVLAYLSLADAYCLCSSGEGMPISLIEALGTHTVPICTPVGGIINTIEDGVNGFLSSDLTEKSYYQALKRFLLLKDEEIAAMKQKARESYRPYSMTECGANYEKLFIEHCKLLAY